MSNSQSLRPFSYGAAPPTPEGTPAQEAVGLQLQPDSLADACGDSPRKKPHSASLSVDVDACGNSPRKKPHSASLSVDVDACGNSPRKKPRSVSLSVDADACGDSPRKKPHSVSLSVDVDARGNSPRKKSRHAGRGMRRRAGPPSRAKARAKGRNADPSMPYLSPDSRDLEGEIALLRTLTNRLLSKRPVNYSLISRNLWLLVRAVSTNYPLPREATDEEQIDGLIKKVIHDNVEKGDLDFRDLVPMQMARPGDKWWPWRSLLPLQTRWAYGLIDPEEPWPHEENEGLYRNGDMLKMLHGAMIGMPPDPDDKDDPPDNEDPSPYEDNPSGSEAPSTYEDNPLGGEAPSTYEDNPLGGEAPSTYEDDPTGSENSSPYEDDPPPESPSPDSPFIHHEGRPLADRSRSLAPHTAENGRTARGRPRPP